MISYLETKEVLCKIILFLFRINSIPLIKMTENSIHMALKESMMAKRMAEVKKIIRNGADLCERNENLETPLHVAISQGFEDVAEVLIKKLTVRMLNTICGSGLTPLYSAVWRNNFKIVQLLLKHGASAIRDSFVSDFDLRSPLQVAFHLKNYKMINLLLEYIPEVSQSEASEIKKLSLEWAVEQEYVHIVKWIVQKVGRYISNERKRHVLKWVKSTKIAELLLEKFYGFYGMRATFRNAVLFEMYGIVEHFIKNDPNIVNYVDPFGKTYLHLAVSASGDIPQIVEFLIKNGFYVNAKGHDNITPLHKAWYGPSIKILIDYGANIYAKTTSGMFPFEIALTRQDKAASFKAFIMNM